MHMKVYKIIGIKRVPKRLDCSSECSGLWEAGNYRYTVVDMKNDNESGG